RGTGEVVFTDVPGDKHYERAGRTLRYNCRARANFSGVPLPLAGEVAAETRVNRAPPAVAMAEASALQGQFWPMHDLLFENQNRLRDADLLSYAHRLRLDLPAVRTAFESDAIAERVRRDFTSGVRSGVNGTPTFFVNGVRFDGDWSKPREFATRLRDFVE